MNQEKIGNFIAKCRKKKKITQEQLAEKLNVSNKTVSRWETGKNLPDYSILPELSKILQVSINDLLSGEFVKKEDYNGKLEENIITNLNIINNKQKIYQKVLLLILLIPVLFGFISIFLNSIQFRINYDKKSMYIDKSFNYNNLRMTYENNCVTYGGDFDHKITTIQENGKTTSIIFVNASCTIKSMLAKGTGNSRRWDNIISKDLIDNNSYKVYYYKGNLNKIYNNNDVIKMYIDKSKLVYEK